MHVNRKTIKRINKFEYVVQMRILGSILYRAGAVDRIHTAYRENDVNSDTIYAIMEDSEKTYCVKMAKTYPNHMRVEGNAVSVFGDVDYLVKRIIQDNTILDMNV